jgi:hypothetical protein
VSYNEFYKTYLKSEIFMPMPYVLQIAVTNVDKYVKDLWVTNTDLFLQFDHGCKGK